MLAATRPNLRLAILSPFLLAAWLPIVAQVQAAPSSGGALGLRDTANSRQGVQPGLATLGANGLSNTLQHFLGNCCRNSFLPRSESQARVRPPMAPGHHRRRRDDDEVVAVPIYIPYAIGYEPDAAETAEGSDTDQSGYGFGRRRESDDAADSDDEAYDADEEMPDEPAEPVVAQPATVLVFKDGHRADVLNYAILGDALFDFDDGSPRKIPLVDLDLSATTKANDALGVEFKLPPSVTGGNAP